MVNKYNVFKFIILISHSNLFKKILLRHIFYILSLCINKHFKKKKNTKNCSTYLEIIFYYFKNLKIMFLKLTNNFKKLII